VVSCWQFPFAIFAWALWFGPILSDCIAEVTCGPCPPGFNQDVAINAAFKVPCFAGSDPNATRLEVQIERQPGGMSSPIVADDDCTIGVALERRVRLRTYARFCDSEHCGEWTEPSYWISRLQSYPLCAGDLNGDGEVDGTDFLLFRGDYMDGCTGQLDE